MMPGKMFANPGRPVLIMALAASLFLPPLLGGCASAPQAVNAPASVADLERFPQSLETLAEQYEGQRGADTVLRSHEDARGDMARFRRRFFEPWDSAAVDSEAL